MSWFRQLFIAGAVLSALALASLYCPVPAKKLSPQSLVSFRILDRNGLVLREVLSDQSGSCTWLSRGDIPPEVAAATLAAEDKFFYSHPGVNLLSLLRAAEQNLIHGHIVSGGSTITQQLARNIQPGPRTVITKILEAWTALRLEKTLTKDEILTQYLNRIYYGSQAYGIEAAARTYFGKSCRDLTLAESAFLAALPRSPGRFQPYFEDARLIRSQKRILKKVFSLGWTGESQYHRALRQDIKLAPLRSWFQAPHFCDFVLANCSSSDRTSGRDIRTTLDLTIQKHIQHLVKEHIKSLSERNITQAAVVVIDNINADIISMVGSVDFFDAYHQGQVNGAVSLRQPGSALKPFTYGLALQQGMSAADVLHDGPVEYATPTGPYQPVNYDHKFHGQVRLRQALACSYNIPAVQLTERMGPERLYMKLKHAGFTTFVRPSSYYGLGLTLGNGEVTLLELAQAYSALSRGGVFQPVRWRKDPALKYAKTRGGFSEKHIFSPEIAYILTHILSDPDARIPAFGYLSPLRLPFACAVKTGTSKDFRDNWAVGFTSAYTVGVWAGNFNGEPMHTISGVTGCGPLFRDVMLLLHRKKAPKGFHAPDSIIHRKICPESGMLVSSRCPGSIEEIFIPGTEPEEICRRHGTPGPDIIPPPAINTGEIRIINPGQGNIYQIDPVLKPDFQTITLQAAVPPGVNVTEFIWYANGRILNTGDFTCRWNLKPGRHIISFKAKIKSGTPQTDSVSITVLK